MIYIASFFVTLIGVGLKGFQHKNVIGNHQRAVFATSCAMAAFDVIAVSLIVTGGWTLMFSTGLGAGCGMVLAMRLHDRVFKR